MSRLIVDGPFAGLPQERANVILADPPWRFATYSAKGRDRCPDGVVIRNESRQNKPERHYATMSENEITTLPVQLLAAADCVLLLWVVDPMIPQALSLGAAWGFTYKTVGFYWTKLRREGSIRHQLHEEPSHKLFPMGTGYWTRANPEQCLLFTRGHLKRIATGVRKLIVSPRREHSRKPDEVFSRIEDLVAGPYVELFSRRTRPGWTCWGNETDKFSECAPAFPWSPPKMPWET